MAGEKTNIIRVLIADDHAVVVEGLRRVLSAEPDMEVVAVAENGSAALEKTRDLKPDVVLLDLSMPEMNGIEATRRIKECLPEVRVVAFSMHEKDAFVCEVLRAGADGYVMKGSPIAEVTRAIRDVVRSGSFLCPGTQGKLIRSFRSRREEGPEGNYDLLTDREQQVFRLIVEGHSTRRIGELLFVSPKTVETHRSNIMRKLKTDSLVEMVKYAVRIGIVDP